MINYRLMARILTNGDLDAIAELEKIQISIGKIIDILKASGSLADEVYIDNGETILSMNDDTVDSENVSVSEIDSDL